jgi:hypothetical protein
MLTISNLAAVMAAVTLLVLLRDGDGVLGTHRVRPRASGAVGAKVGAAAVMSMTSTAMALGVEALAEHQLWQRGVE